MIVYPDKFITTSGAVRKLRKKVPGLVFHTGHKDLTATEEGAKELEEITRGIKNHLARMEPRPAGMHYPVTLDGVKNAKENALSEQERDRAVKAGMIPLHSLPQYGYALHIWGYTTTYPHPSQDRHLTIQEVAVVLTLLQNAISSEPYPVSHVLEKLGAKFLSDSAIIETVDPVYGEGPAVVFKCEPHSLSMFQLFLGKEGAKALYSEMAPKFLTSYVSVSQPGPDSRCFLRTHRKPGWYWVTTAVTGRTPHKKQVPLEWYYEKENESMGLEPYVWLDSNQEEVFDKIVSVNEERIHEPRN
tara:strand:- start:3990 stop:4892 length:903 start_codon:yes stop_codon:yes gene_type:complete